jgi:methionine-rich copper-binding protein CopC
LVMISRWRVAVGLIVLALVAASPVGAHSALIRANPSPNAVSSRPPEEIRLWFSEALEPEFSRITLRDSQGNTLDTLPSQVAGGATHKCF